MQTVTARAPARSERTTTSAKPRRSQKGPIFWVVLGLVGIFLLIAGIKGLQFAKMIKQGKATVLPPTTVTSAKVKKGDWVPMLTAIGSISPVQGATISAELAGTVGEMGFESGAPVKKGRYADTDRHFRRGSATPSAQADAELAKANLDRAQDLSKNTVISKSELEPRPRITTRQSAVDNMQSMIDKKTISAPFEGIAGIREVNPGQMVPVGDKLVTLQALDNVFVDFSLPQHDLAKVAVGLEVKVTTDAIQGREFKGTLRAINSAIDSATRSVEVQATLENEDHALRAGMFAKVEVVLPQKNSTLFIPATAVLLCALRRFRLPDREKAEQETGKDELILRQQFIRLGESRGAACGRAAPGGRRRRGDNRAWSASL